MDILGSIIMSHLRNGSNGHCGDAIATPDASYATMLAHIVMTVVHATPADTEHTGWNCLIAVQLSHVEGHELQYA